MYAYMLWADTTAGIMKMRNGANSAWVSLWELDGTFIATDISLSAGTAGAPSLYFTGDTNTGIYSPGADQLAISTGGTGRLFVDASGRLGVGSSSPTGQLHVEGGQTYMNRSGAGNQQVLQLNNSDTTAGTQIVKLAFGSSGSTKASINAAVYGNDYLAFNTGSDTERMRLTGTGLGIGTSSPGVKLTVVGSPGDLAAFSNATDASVVISASSGVAKFTNDAASGAIAFGTGSSGTERLRITSGGNVGIGATPDSKLHVFDAIGNALRIGYDSGVTNKNIYDANQHLFRDVNGNSSVTIDSSKRLLVGTSSTSVNSTLVLQGASGSTNAIIRPCLSNSSPGTEDQIGMIAFGDSSQRDLAYFFCARDSGTWTAGSSQPTRLVFSTTADGASSPTERMRISNTGIVTSKTSNIGSVTGAGWGLDPSGAAIFTVSGAECLYVNREVNDGSIISIRQAGAEEGTISVSGTTVSYNGAHLSRWSQLPSGAERIEILRGSVLSNLDEMCEWGEEDNEQLNRMKVSDVEGDKNVSGVFQAWDDDDDTYINDFYCAMTGDFIIRIGAGTTVERGDLLMSAGDGTAKPQDDDIIRSKTIAKVTSTNVSCTYEDGSYCVPCVLMAC
jgi:hypothetical protein